MIQISYRNCHISPSIAGAVGGPLRLRQWPECLALNSPQMYIDPDGRNAAVEGLLARRGGVLRLYAWQQMGLFLSVTPSVL